MLKLLDSIVFLLLFISKLFIFVTGFFLFLRLKIDYQCVTDIGIVKLIEGLLSSFSIFS
jgi:hypothetical protein